MALMRGLAGEGFRMLLITALSFLLGYALTIAGTEWLGLDARVAYALSIALCTIGNFFAYRYYIFAERHGTLAAAAAKFFPTMIAFRAAEVGMFSLLTHLGVHYQLAYVLTAGTAFVAKFVTAKLFVFGARRG